jgi:hypothetical protein
VKRKMTETPEPKDKLDAATAPVGVVGGPQDDALRWRQIDWRRAERMYGGCGSGSSRRVRRGTSQGSAGCRS